MSGGICENSPIGGADGTDTCDSNVGGGWANTLGVCSCVGIVPM